MNQKRLLSGKRFLIYESRRLSKNKPAWVTKRVYLYL
jgi:hypothetical protein